MITQIQASFKMYLNEITPLNDDGKGKYLNLGFQEKSRQITNKGKH